MTDKPRFRLELYFSGVSGGIKVQDPMILSDKIMDQAWQLVNDFVIDALDSLKLEVDDEQFREILIELCYKLVYREMTTLNLLPVWERGWKEDLGTRRTGMREDKRGPYDDR